MALSSKDQIKIINAGFTIIRADYERKVIKHKTFGQLEWKDMEKGFSSRAAVIRRMNELLEKKEIITD